jgi:hypothetical protein
VAISRQNVPQARTFLLTALAIDAGNSELNSLLAGLQAPDVTTTTIDPFTAAKRLDEAGYRKEAEALVAEALKAGKTLPESAVDRLDKHRSTGKFLLDNWLRVALGIASLAALLREILLRSTLRTSKTWPWTKRPLIVSATIAGDDNVALAALTRHQLRRIGDEVDDVRLAIAPVPEQSIDLPDLSDFDAKLKPFMTAWRWMLRRDVLTASELFPAADKATNNRLLALEFFDRRTTLSTEWQLAGVTDASLQLRLAAAYAAGWIAVRAPELRPHLGSAERTSRLGTASPSSLAAFSAGIEAWDAGRVALATHLFYQAVIEDDMHQRAVHNHSVGMIGTGVPASMAAASVQLMRLLAPPPATHSGME